MRSEYEGQTKWSVTGGHIYRPSIVCNIVRCANLHAKVILSIMKFFYLFYHVYYVIALEGLAKALGAVLRIHHSNGPRSCPTDKKYYLEVWLDGMVMK